MRTTTLALLSGAAMSISAASIYNVTPAGGLGESELHASLEPLAPRTWPQLESASASGLVAFASTAAPAASAAPTVTTLVDEPVAASPAFAPAAAAPRSESPPQFAAAKPPSTKIARGWRAHRNPKPAFEPSFSEPQRAAVVRQEPPPQLSRPISTAPSFQNAPPASFAAPASTARPMSTSNARSTQSAF